ncbi:SGNH/GDSL hydrolase family protein [Paenibacillus qinlingensis]|uniref:Lysophospholipase L1-like esterase n=1 Tax=Paenibacillus qinlingensis TaxID=1837343 RepID=A0ABU1NW34_9BACL|nr:SGNH/GDSL hydrolase family protein [Paenibacillus qinlingensis]MDR6551685.1 lysophospholipase L1-like esterase [Paenibacillus qinlingensis]
MTSSWANQWVNHRGGLPHFKEKLLRDEPIVVAFIGGSITEGAGASDLTTTSWRALTERYLKQQFTADKVRCINAGVGGTTSTFGAHRLHEHVLSQGEIDLLFVEFSVNDGLDRDESIRGMEGIVRQCRRLSPRTDICYIYTAADKNLTEHVPFNIAVHEEVASYYDIPSVNFAARVYSLMQTDEVQWDDLASDRVHPNDSGHALYAAFVREYLDEALGAKVDTHAVNGDAAVLLPQPMDPNNYEYAAMLEVDFATSLEGFVWKELSSEPLMNWRYDTRHLYADTLDGSLSFTVEGQYAGVLLLCGPDSGIFEYAIDGEPFQAIQLFDDWCLKAYRPIMTLFPLPEDRQSRRITIRHTGRKDERSTGTSLRILKLFSN